MNTMEITKFVGAGCGSLLVFLLIGQFAFELFSPHAERPGYEIPVEETSAEAAPEETVDVAALMSEADPAKGESVFKKCAACHSTAAGENKVGPTLHGVIGRKIASEAGFSYSSALTGLEGNWGPEQLFGFLEDPKGFAPGTAMSFAGLPKPEDRANVIAYLETQK